MCCTKVLQQFNFADLYFFFLLLSTSTCCGEQFSNASCVNLCKAAFSLEINLFVYE